jgi:hypothetical protein
MIRRVLFATFWFVIFWLALLVAGLGITDSLQARPSPGSAEGFRSGYEAGAAAGAEFRDRYGWVVLTVAGLLAAGGSIAGILPGTRK